MIKTLSKYIKEYKLATVLTPLVMVLEVIFETVIPVFMGWIIKYGINGNNGNGDMSYILKMGGIMVVLVILAFVSGVLGAVF
ncbi:MAG: ABC transporter ATP-binding protein, partial [Lachnospiraceae bacterium]|nr:ABC transporter ATP-binding protein [Lachnospiraceae bacterium]